MKGRKRRPMRTYGVRLDADMARAAKRIGINVGLLLRTELARAIAAKDGKCPACGHTRPVEWWAEHG